MTTRMTVQRLGRLIADGDVDAVRSAVEASPRLLARTVERDGQGGWTPLHVAVVEGQAEVVRALVGAGADVAARTEHHRTPLHVALQYHPDLVPLLLELGAVLDAPSAAYLNDVDHLARHSRTAPGPTTGRRASTSCPGRRSAVRPPPPGCSSNAVPTPTAVPSTRRPAAPG